MAEKNTGVWKGVWIITAWFNAVLTLVAIAWLGQKGLIYDGEIKASDLVVIVLAAVTVVLAALALVIGGLAVWGFAEIRKAAETAATEAATRTAAIVARDTAVSAATRTLYAERSLQTEGESPNTVESGPGLDPLSAALVSDREK